MTFIRQIFLGALFFSFAVTSTAQAQSTLPIQYGNKQIDLLSFIGAGFLIMAMVDERNDDIYWMRDAMNSVEVIKVGRTASGGYDDTKSKIVFDLGRRTVIQPRGRFNPLDNFFYFVTDNNSDETYNVFRLDPKKRIFQQVSYAAYAAAFELSQNQKLLFYHGRDNPLSGEVCLREKKADSSKAEKRLLCDHEGLRIYFFVDPFIDQQDRYVASYMIRDGLRTNANIGIYDRQTNTVKTVYPPTTTGQTISMLDWANGEFYFAMTRQGMTATYAYDPVTTAIRMVRQHTGTVLGAYSNKLKLLMTQEPAGGGTNGNTNMVFYDPMKKEVVKVANMGGYTYDIYTPRFEMKDGSHFALVRRQDSLTKALAKVSPNGSIVVQPLFIPEVEKKLKQSCEVEDFTYETFDKDLMGAQRKIHGVLFRPRIPATKPAAVIFAHGGPSSSTTKSYNMWIQSLCEAGYFVYGPNVRGSTGYGKEFEDLNNNDWAGGDALDYEYARRAILQKFNLAPQRVGILGGSYGGYMTNWAMTRPNNQFAFGVNHYGMSDLFLGLEGNTADMQIGEIGDPRKSEGVKRFYSERSPINWAKDLKNPFLLIHGEMDRRVHVEHSRRFATALTQENKVFEYYEAKGEGHGWRYLGEIQKLYQKTFQFLWTHAPTE
ncbi:MAG: alpha/beta hydrolase family protein [Bdellovibrionales bacterium]